MGDHRSHATRRRFTAALAALPFAALLVIASPSPATAQLAAPAAPAGPVALTIPQPGSSTAAPATTLQLDGSTRIEPQVVVTGSESGVHTGSMTPIAGTTRWTFAPDAPFAPGETVTVAGTHQGDEQSFTVGTPAPHPGILLADEERGAADGSVRSAAVGDPAHTFVSRPDLHPSKVTVAIDTGGAAEGLIFSSPRGSSAAGTQSGILVYDDEGEPVWFQPEPDVDLAADPKVVEYGGETLLTWFRGDAPYGAGNYRGEWKVVDEAYRHVTTIRMGNGYQADVHDIWFTDAGSAYLMAYNPLVCTGFAPLDHCTEGATVLEGVVQEIDVATGAVLWEWHSLDHVPLSDGVGDSSSPLFDYFHINSVAEDLDGDVLVSARNTSALYKIDRSTGDVLWTFGGRSSTFEGSVVGDPDGEHPGPDYPHHLRAVGVNSYTYFDNGNVRGESRGAAFSVNPVLEVVTYDFLRYHDPAIFAPTQGNMQEQPNGNHLVSWGGLGVFTEYDSIGNPVFEASFDAGGSYRQIRQPWTGRPAAPPAVVLTPTAGGADVHVSWNGDTETEAWRVLAGPTRNSLSPATTVPRDGFETTVSLSPAPGWVAVEAIGAGDEVLARSAPVHDGRWYDESPWTPVSIASQPLVGDFGGSRNDDVFLYRPGASQDVLLVSDGDGSTTNVPVPNVNGSYTPLVADVIGDDRDEIIWVRPGLSTGYVWRFDRSPRTSAPTIDDGMFHPPSTFTTALVLDHRISYGGPARDEILFYGVGGRTDRIDRFSWPSSGALHRTSRAITVNGTYQPITGDFDGNGLADIFWYAPGRGADYLWFTTGTRSGATGHRSASAPVNGSYELHVGNFADNELRDEVLFRATAGSGYLWTFDAEGARASRRVATAAAPGTARVIEGPNDRLLTWEAGEEPAVLSVDSGSTVTPTGNSALAPGYVPVVGRFVGDTNESSIVWLGTGALTEVLFTPR